VELGTRRENMLARDERGAVFAEYVTLLALVSLGCAIATVALGVPFNHLFIFQRSILLLPIP
jgi:Flp pilus assembly pilin Flp